MMEELKELVHLLNSMPALALWVAIGFWAYKVIVVGSIYGVIRFVIIKLVEAMRTRGEHKIAEAQALRVQPLIYDSGSFMASEEVWNSVKDLLYGMRSGDGSKKMYFGTAEAVRLREAVELLRKKEADEKAVKRYQA